MHIRKHRTLLRYLVLFSLSLMAFFSYKHFICLPSKKIEKYEIQFAYPVISINPLYYDDWESNFIGNHIYYRLLPEINRIFIPAITDRISITCSKPKSLILNNQCQVIRIAFNPKEFFDCNGRHYTIDDISKEFELLLNKKNWIIPSWKKCIDMNNKICITGKYFPDQLRRIQGVNFRFGWLKSKVEDKVYGAGPYCLFASYGEKSVIKGGALIPNNASINLPIINFHTSRDPNQSFQMALYGSANLIRGKRKNIQAHTPLPYYVISNSIKQNSYPWNTEEASQTIRDFLKKNKIIYSNMPGFYKYISSGSALHNKKGNFLSRQLMFAIPNYLPKCQNLADRLNKKWKNIYNAKAYCTNIVNFVYESVINRKRGWDGFLVGVSPSDPSRDSILYQYFSEDSLTSWSYKYKKAKNLFYLIGIGQSLITVDGETICNIRPNPLGLSDIFITDLIPCRR